MLRPLACLLSLSFAFATAAAAPASQPLRVTGRILSPVPADLRVELVPLVSGYAEAARFLAGEPIPPVVTAQPRVDGSFEILAPESGLYRVRLRAEKYLPVEVLLIPLVEDIELPPVTLQPAPALQITVLGPDGQPVPRLRLRALSVQAFGIGAQIVWRPAQSDGVTDAAGMVSLPQGGVPELSLVALAAGVPDRFVEKVEGSRHILRLKQSEPRVVEVRGRDSKPLAGALVRWNNMPFGFTGSDGRLALPATTSGATLRLEDAGGFLAEVPVAPEEKGLISVRLPAGRTITGRVLDAASRAPLAGALVWGGDHRHVHAAADGRFSLRVFGTGEVTVDAAAAGHLSSPAQVRPDEQLVTCALRPTARIEGMVTDEPGHPVAGAEIQAQRADGRSVSSPSQVTVLSGADGRFRLAGLAAGQIYEITAKREGFATATVPVEALHAGKRSPVRIVLRRGAIMAGRVVDAAGDPVSGAELTLRAVSWRMRSPGVQVLSDATGHFHFSDLSSGLFDLRASRSGFAATVVLGVEIPAMSRTEHAVPAVPMPRAVDLGEITLRPGAAIEGRVIDRRGAPIAKAEVKIECSDFFPWSMLRVIRNEPLATGADGRFRIEDLTPGSSCRLSIQHAGHTPAQLPGVQAPTREPLRIELATARVLSGRITGPLDEPVSGAFVQVEPREVRLGSGGRFSPEGGGRTDAEGHFRLENLPAGLLDLTVSAPGYRQKTAHAVEVPEAGGPPLEISLAKGETLTGTVVDSHGDPVADATIRAILNEAWAGNAQPVDGVTNGEGHYHLDGLEAGTYMANVASPDGEHASASVTVLPGLNRLDFTFPGGEVEGRVLDRDGAPISGAAASLQSVDRPGMPYTATTATDGTFRLRAVADGDYFLGAEAEGFAAPAQPDEIHVSGQAVQGLELRLDRGAVLTGKLIGVAPDLVRWGAIRASSQPHTGLFSWPTGVVIGDGYRIAGLHAGTWEVTAFTTDGRSAHGSVEIEPGMDQATLDLEWAAGYTLSGRILVDHAPLADAFLYLQQIPEANFSGGGFPRSAWDGSFQVPGLAPGRYRISISTLTGINHSEEIEISGDREVSFEIFTGSLNGEILSATGAPVSGALVSLSGESPGSGGPTLRSDEQGRFEVGHLAAGSYRVAVQQKGFAAAESRIVITPGGTVQMQVVLKEIR